MRKQVHARAVVDGTVVAESERAIVVEGNHYFPAESVREEFLEPCGGRSLCPWKGVASYYRVRVGDSAPAVSAWTYRHPAPLARRVKGRIAFRGDVDVSLV